MMSALRSVGFLPGIVIAVWAAALTGLPALGASEVAASRAADEDPVVAVIFGEPIHASDLKPPTPAGGPAGNRPLSPAELDRRAAQELSRRIITPLRDRFIEENSLQPTAEELTEAATGIRRMMARNREKRRKELATVTATLRAGGLDDRTRKRLTRSREALEQSIKNDRQTQSRSSEDQARLQAELDRAMRERDRLRASLETQPADSPRRAELTEQIRKTDEEIRTREWLNMDLPEQMAHWLLGGWKLNRALYRKYGGVVIWQQAGTEAVGAMRSFLEEHEQAGHFAIHDPKLREEFWRYYRREDHPFQVKKPDPFDRMPWEEEPTTRAD